MNNWYEIKEQSAGKYRLLFLWYVYKIFKLSGLKFMLRLILPFIIVFSKSARVNSKKYRMILNNFQKSHNLKVAKFSSYSHISSYALSLAEKFSVLCDDKTSLKFDVNKNENWVEFLDILILFHNNQFYTDVLYSLQLLVHNLILMIYPLLILALLLILSCLIF